MYNVCKYSKELQVKCKLSLNQSRSGLYIFHHLTPHQIRDLRWLSNVFFKYIQYILLFTRHIETGIKPMCIYVLIFFLLHQYCHLLISECTKFHLHSLEINKTCTHCVARKILPFILSSCVYVRTSVFGARYCFSSLLQAHRN